MLWDFMWHVDSRYFLLTNYHIFNTGLMSAPLPSTFTRLDVIQTRLDCAWAQACVSIQMDKIMPMLVFVVFVNTCDGGREDVRLLANIFRILLINGPAIE